jgi:hypothetical protein
VFDPDGLVADARAADAAETNAAIVSLADQDVAVLSGATDEQVVVAWVSTPCDRQVALWVQGHALTVEFAPRQGCDALAIVRAVLLRFTTAVRPAAFEVRVIPPDHPA